MILKNRKTEKLKLVVYFNRPNDLKANPILLSLTKLSYPNFIKKYFM
jgi:hypothetical protein